MLVWIVLWWRRTPPAARPADDMSPRVWIVAVTAVAGAALLGGATVALRATAGATPVRLDALGFAVITRGAMAGALVALVLAVAWVATRRDQAR